MAMVTTSTWAPEARKIPVKPISEFILGCDLGQSVDPTAICLLHHVRTPLDSYTEVDLRRYDKQPFEKVKHHYKNPPLKQDSTESFEVKHLERMPLGTPYPVVVEHVGRLLVRPPLLEAKCKLVIDETGVGRAVGDMFRAAAIPATRVTITAGLQQTSSGADSYNVAKSILISGLDAAIHLGTLSIPSGRPEADALLDELKNFQRNKGHAGRYTYEAKVGEHDDLVLALCLCIWKATRGRFEWSVKHNAF